MVLTVVFKLCGCDIANNCNKCGQWNCNWGRGVSKSLNVDCGRGLFFIDLVFHLN